ncbi:MAG: H-type lectin domain-containing protein [Rhodobacter sp.]|nr:H-type lectin domain-containing protein [Rhodobacter sp.]
MRKIDSRTLGIDQGNALLFSDFDVGGEMWAGSGPRCKRVPIHFSERYRNKPAVQVQIDMWDMDVRSNQRAEIKAENISRDGFDIVFKTWGDTRVARVSASWTALGQVAHEDDWEV